MENSLTILLYHGVTDVESKGIENFSAKHIQAKDFDEQMKFIKQKYNVLSMDEVVEIHKNKDAYPPNSVAVTFDDGFRNNYSVAAPILEKYRVPATFYITSGIINTDIMFWVDELEDCINLTKESSINVSLGNNAKSYDLSTEKSKISSLVDIKSFCKKSSSPVKNNIIRQVIEQTGVQPSVTHAKNYEKMNWQELREMHQSDLFIIGGHSLYHDILSEIPSSKKLEMDISTSIALLKYNLNTDSVPHYSYPEGQEHHYNKEVIQYLKQYGVSCSPSAIHGINDRSVDLFNLKRIMVGFMGTAFPLK